MESLKEIRELGRELGYEGEDLKNFVKEQQDRQREERREKREILQKEQEIQREKQEYELKMAQMRFEQDKAAYEAESKVREHQQKLEMLEKQQLFKENESFLSDNKSNANFPKVPKIPPFEESQDEMDSYLNRFERYATVLNWKREIWATNLSALLKGRALDVYARLPVDKALNYDELKSALLKRFELTEEGFKNKFRSCKPEGGETYAQFTARLESYLCRWIEMAEIDYTYESLLDLMVRDQFLQICNRELKLFLLERKPCTSKEMSGLADQYREARSLPASSFTRELSKDTQRSGERSRTNANRSNVNNNSGRQSFDRPRPLHTKHCYRCGRVGHIASDCNARFSQHKPIASVSTAHESRGDSPSPRRVHFRNTEPRSDREATRSPNRSSSPNRTYTQVCGAFLPLTYSSSLAEGSTYTSVCNSPVSQLKMPTTKGLVDSKVVTVLRDTGCSGVVVRKSCVSEEHITGKLQVCVLVDGTKVEVPVASVMIDTPYFTGQVEAWCMENPIYDLIIGNVDGARNPESPDPDWNLVQAVQTRSQVRQTNRAQAKNLLVPDIVKDTCNPDEISKEQQKDPTLRKVREIIVNDAQQNDKARYFKKQDLIFREYSSPSVENGKKFKQLVVPKSLRDTVLKLAHESIMAGHLDTKRTLSKVLSEFYWPGVSSDVKRFCQSCDICQRTLPKGKITKAPLGSMPLIDVPFKRVAIDLICPLVPRSDRGKRYILTLIDYATRYAEAIPLSSIDTESVAESLLEIFCRLGVPEEILLDLGSQFTSDLMKEVSRLLSFKQLTTTPYHPICNGFCEKLNGSIKMMLKRLCAERPKDWDRYVEPLMFAYRDSPQENLGFTPFELIYGRSVRGPMKILKELWTKEIPDNEVKSSYQYVLDLRDRLEETCEIAHNSLMKCSSRYKRLYNRRARTKKLKVGDKALILLPTKSNKLLLQWKGPFTITERVGALDYKLKVGSKEKTFHANMLKPYLERSTKKNSSAVIGLAVIDVECEEDASHSFDKDILVETPASTQGKTLEPKISDDLQSYQVSELKKLLQQFPDVLSDKPGFTNLGKHDIKLTTSELIRVKPYPIPFALQETVKEEVGNMLDLGVIEPSTSEYCSNIVLVKKPDGSIRFCIDFRPLNRHTVFDCEPIPNMEEIFVKMSKCKYISKLDLTKGYWQLPLTDSAKPLTAFQTPLGLFQFRTMPFGLVCASASFSRIMRRLLSNMTNIDNFIDDIFLYTQTFLHHLQVLTELYLRLRNAQLTVKPSKCCFGFKSIVCLGHIIGNDMLQVVSEKVEAVKEAGRPTTKKQPYIFRVVAIRGRDNVAADCLSRL